MSSCILEEIIYSEILVRLPVKTLLFTTHTRKPILMLETSESSSRSNRLCSIGYDSLESSVSEIISWDIEIDFPFKFKSYYAHLLTDDYKLSVGVTASKDTVFQFYSLASNSWKLGPTVPYRISYTAVVVNGYHHWLVKAQDTFFLLSLDICDDSSKEMKLPNEPLEKSCEDEYISPGVLEGCLCILDSSYVNHVKINVEVWKMLDYGVHESWTKRYIITHESIIWGHYLSLVALWSFENGKILFMNSGGLVLYDLRTWKC
ncbi:F-box protein CPR1-like [Papaver somniferum]|uniref:F-box protein CPR1-like n=1 Tax=Papaver somniferum TaxID=3469 RepID=UPI000E6F9450|nr:F-box protein CPR1-like [Papaver somniferum]